MSNTTGSICSAIAVTAIASLMMVSAQAEEPPCPFDENRAGLCGYYKSEISPAEAYLHTVVQRGFVNLGSGGRLGNPLLRAVIVDVRSIPEYKAGHPERSYNVPYPFIYQFCDERGRHPDGACVARTSQIDQNDADFLSYIQKIIPNQDTPIYLLCRTGVRSVAAGNLLTDAGYTHVRNIWEGFVGVFLTAPKLQEDGSRVISAVDLNHDLVLDDRDKNGWRYHQGLPYETRLLPWLIYQPMADLYTWVD